MADWDGRGLPPVAAERARRAAAGGAWTSLLSAPAAAGLKVVGFKPVGEVMGSIVQQIGWSGYGGCGIYGGYGGYGGWATPTITSSDPMHFAGFRPYVEALYRAALGRSSVGDAGSQLWLDLLRDGADLGMVAQQVLESREGRRAVAAHLYDVFLERTADSQGLDFWTNALEDGLTEEKAMVGFLAADEFFSRL